MIETFIGIMLGGVISWLITHSYHKKQEQSVPPSLFKDIKHSFHDLMELGEEISQKVNHIHELARSGENEKIEKITNELLVDVSDSQKKISYLPEYTESMLKFYSSAMAASNGLQYSLIEQAKKNRGKFKKDQVVKETLQWCRAFFDLTAPVISTSPPKGIEDIKSMFRVVYWQPDSAGNFRITDYSLPSDANIDEVKKLIHHDDKENIIHKVFSESKTIVASMSDKNKKLTSHLNNGTYILTIAAFPAIDPTNNNTTGVLSVDTRISNYFNDDTKELLNSLVKSFNLNLTLAGNL